MELDLSMFGDDDFEENNKIISQVDEEDEEKDDDIIGDLPKHKKNVDDDFVAESNDDEDSDDDDKKNDDDSDEKSSDDDIKLVYNNIATLLKEEGMFTDEEMDLTKIESSNDLVEALKAEIKRNEYSDLSDNQKEYLEALRNGIPQDIFIEHKKAEATYESITESMIAEDEALRKRIIMAEFGTKNIQGTRAEKLYNSMVSNGDDISEAVESLNNLKALEAVEYAETIKTIEKQKADNKKAELKRISDVKASVYDKKEIIKNYKLTETLKDQVYEAMTKAVGYNEEGQPINKLTSERSKNPVEFDTKLYYLFTMTKGFNDFSIFEKKAQSKAAENLERIVKDSNILRTGSNSLLGDDNEPIPQFVKISKDY